MYPCTSVLGVWGSDVEDKQWGTTKKREEGQSRTLPLYADRAPLDDCILPHNKVYQGGQPRHVFFNNRATSTCLFHSTCAPGRCLGEHRETAETKAFEAKMAGGVPDTGRLMRVQAQGGWGTRSVHM